MGRAGTRWDAPADRRTGGPADPNRVEGMEDSWTRPEPEVEVEVGDEVALPCVGTRCDLAPDKPVLLLSSNTIYGRAGPALFATTQLRVLKSRLALVYLTEAGVETGAILMGMSLAADSLPPLICQRCAARYPRMAARAGRGATELAEQLADGAQLATELAQLAGEPDDRQYDLMVDHLVFTD